MYPELKNVHLLSIAMSATLLSARYLLLMTNSSMVDKKLLRILPHIVDSILLLSGVGLVFVINFVPFTAGHEWFTEKVSCILAYFALSFFTLRVAKNGLLRTFAFLGALGWLVMAGNVAVTKMPILMG